MMVLRLALAAMTLTSVAWQCAEIGHVPGSHPQQQRSSQLAEPSPPIAEEGDEPAEPETQTIAASRVAEAASTVEFARDLQPILADRCQPCHFPGGTMYARLPFDQGATIDELGERIFSRIKDPQQQALFRRYVSQRARP